MTAAILLAVGAALLLWAWTVWQGYSQDWKPEDLKAARLVAVEQDYEAEHQGWVLMGRPDQVYKLASGEHVVIELKNRDRADAVYATDIAEASLRAWLLRRNGMVTAQYAYIVINDRKTGVRKANRVTVKPDAACIELVERHMAVVDGRQRPRLAADRRCRSCGHAVRCEAGRRAA